MLIRHSINAGRMMRGIVRGERGGSMLMGRRSGMMALFSSITEGLISSMNQVTQGDRFYQDRNIPQAIAYYEQSFTILPLYLKDNPHYKAELQALASRLATCYAWRGELGKVESLTTRILQAANREQVSPGEEVQTLSDALSITGRVQTPIHQVRNQIIKEVFASVHTKLQGKDATIPTELIKSTKGLQPNITDLSPYLHNELKSSSAFVMLSLLAFPSFSSNQNYNKLCNSLLKSAQKSSQKNVIKALTLLVTNLLRNGQYLQAEGMLQYCLQRKRENLKENLLRTNQEYILLQLLLANTFEGVQRLQESRRLKEEFSPRLDLSLLVGQHFLLDSL